MNVEEMLEKVTKLIETHNETIKNYNPVAIDSTPIINDFNRNFEVPHGIKKDKKEQFEKFCEQIFETQANTHCYGFSCGVDSAHASLVPRITSGGNFVLVCPTCGYVQDTMWFINQKA